MWPSVTSLNHMRVALVLPSLPSVRRHTCFSCSSETMEGCAPSYPQPHPHCGTNESHHMASVCPTSLFLDLYKTSLHFIFMSWVILPTNINPSTIFMGQNVCVCVCVCLSDQKLLVSVQPLTMSHKLDDVSLLPLSVLSSHPETQCPSALPLLTVELIGTWL